MAGPSLKEVRQFLACEAGPFHSGTSTAGTVASTFEDTTWPFKSTIAQESLFLNMGVFMPSLAATDQVRIIKTYTPEDGQATVDNGYGVNPGAGVPYEIHGIFTDPREITVLINDGLKECLIPAEFNFVPANNVDVRHSLATVAPWLTNPNWVRQVGLLATSQDRMRYRPSAIYGDVSVDGATLYLEIGAISTTQTVYVQALKPAYFHCAAAGGVYGSQEGLALDTDTVPDTVSVAWAAYAGLVIGWRRLGQILAANDRVKLSQAQAEEKFRAHDPDYEYSETAARSLEPVRAWGPSC